MSECCAECITSIVSNDHSIGCFGVCGKKFHTKCLADTNPHYKKIDIGTLLMHLPNLQWYCNDCLQFTLEGAFKGIIRKINDCAVAVSSITQPNRLKPIQRGRLNSPAAFASDTTPSRSALNHLQQQNTDSHVSLYSQTELLLNANHQQQHTQNNTVDLTQSSSGESNPACSQDAMAVDQTQSAVNIHDMGNSQKRKISPNILTPKRNKPATESLSLSDLVYTENGVQTNKKSSTRDIYISRFKPTTETSDILHHLDKVAGMDIPLNRISCTKLTSNKRIARNLSFVSFKLTVPEDLFDSMLNPSLWPPSIKPKEFVATPKTQLSVQKGPKTKSNKPKVAKRPSKNPQTPFSTPQQKRVSWKTPMGQSIQGFPPLQPQLNHFNPQPYFQMIPIQFPLPNQYQQAFGIRN